jgi:hypothetical protein
MIAFRVARVVLKPLPGPSSFRAGLELKIGNIWPIAMRKRPTAWSHQNLSDFHVLDAPRFLVTNIYCLCETCSRADSWGAEIPQLTGSWESPVIYRQ